MFNKNLLLFCSIAEATTGVALIILPSTVIQLLFGEDVSGLTLAITQFSGICLIGFAIACWPGQNLIQALRAMTFYNLLVTIFFIYIGLSFLKTGILLWPVAILHLVLGALLINALLKSRSKQD
jgi:hypothetical protein